MKLLVDMNLSPRWISLLADARIEAAHWSTIGATKATDAEIMTFTKANGTWCSRTTWTSAQFLAVTHGDKPSVVQIRAEDVSLDVIGRPVIDALRQMTTELEEGALLTIDPNRTRLRLLPLQPR